MGHWCTNPEDITTVLSYYSDLFTSEPIQQLEETITSIHGIVSADMNDQLSSQFMAWEVQEEIEQMAPLKAPGSNGMLSIFYQNYQSLIGDDITLSILQFLNSTSLPTHLNHTSITLIPKVKCFELVFEFFPISLLLFCTKSSLRFWLIGSKKSYLKLLLSIGVLLLKAD